MPSNLFYVDPVGDRRITYAEFAEDVMRIGAAPPVIRSADCYALFCSLAAAIERGQPVTLAATDAVANSELCEPHMSEDGAGQGELIEAQTSMDGAVQGRVVTPHSSADGSRQRGAVTALRSLRPTSWPASQARIGIYSSGTSGRPRLIEHTLTTLTRTVRTGEHHRHDVWGFAYHPAHFAGVQVFLQAVINGNPLVRLWGLGPTEQHAAIEAYGVTHLSATPTLLQMLCDGSMIHPTMQRITTGGELATPQLLHNLAETFPNAKIANIYASTEVGSLLLARGDCFQVPSELAQLVRIIDQQLAVHRSLLAASLNDANDPSTIVDDFYLTGDRVELVSAQPLQFRFVGRRGDIINVGGYKVNPHDVEVELLQLPEVIDARVYAIPNSVTGNLVGCDLSLSKGSQLSVRSIRQRLASRLKDYMIPRIVNFVDIIPSTASGKKVRQ